MAINKPNRLAFPHFRAIPQAHQPFSSPQDSLLTTTHRFASFPPKQELNRPRHQLTHSSQTQAHSPVPGCSSFHPHAWLSSCVRHGMPATPAAVQHLITTARPCRPRPCAHVIGWLRTIGQTSHGSEPVDRVCTSGCLLHFVSRPVRHHEEQLFSRMATFCMKTHLYAHDLQTLQLHLIKPAPQTRPQP